MVDNALIGTTEFDIFSLDPATCAENWRTHEDYPPLFCRSTEAPPTWTACCFAAPRTGGCWPMTSRPEANWETTIADPKKGESVPAGPDRLGRPRLHRQCRRRFKGVKGRMYALDAKTGEIVWEFYLVPKVRR